MKMKISDNRKMSEMREASSVSNRRQRIKNIAPLWRAQRASLHHAATWDRNARQSAPAAIALRAW